MPPSSDPSTFPIPPEALGAGQNVEPYDPAKDPDWTPSLGELEKADFLKDEPAQLQQLKKQLAAAEQSGIPADDPFRNLFILTYKGNGPVTSVLFRSKKPSPLIVRDCQIYCKSIGARYLGFTKALVEISVREGAESLHNPADISSLVTAQSRLIHPGSVSGSSSLDQKDMKKDAPSI
jgi:hypothetical protein